MTQKNQKIAPSPYILGRLNTCANSVYQALLHFSHAPGMRLPTGLKLTHINIMSVRLTHS